MTRIVVFLREFPKGSETFVLDQVTGLLDRDIDVGVVAMRCGRAGDAVHREFEDYGLAERTLYLADEAGRLGGHRVGWSAGHLAWGVWKGRVLRYGNKAINGALRGMLRAWRREAEAPDGERWSRPDAVLTHFGPNGDVAVCLRNMGAFHAPVATVLHGNDVSEPLLAGRPLYPRLRKWGDLVLPISWRWESALLEAGFDRSRIRIHRVGVSVPPPEEAAGRNYATGEPLRLMSVCRLVEKKGTVFALEALAELKRAGGPPFVFTIVGDGPLREDLERRCVELGIEDEVVFTGVLPRHQVVVHYRGNHLFVLPSVTSSTGDQEGIPTVLMEAMARGLVVISTLHSGIPELVEDGVSGRLVPERDVPALAAAIREAAEHPEKWPAMRRAARARVEAEFEIESLNDRLRDLLEELAQRGEAPEAVDSGRGCASTYRAV